MALKALETRRQILALQAQRRTLETKLRINQKRADSLDEQLEAAEDDSNFGTLEEQIDALNQAKADLQAQIEVIDAKIAELEAQLKADESAQPASGGEPAAEPAPEATAGRPQPGYVGPMAGNARNRTVYNIRDAVHGWTISQRNAFLHAPGMDEFLSNVREAISHKRAISNVGLTIPDNMLELIREAIPYESKLIGRVRLQSVKGTARQNIAGGVPEAVWTEMCANLNELDLSFAQIEVDGYKVGGFMVLCNAVLEDSDLDLAAEITDALSRSLAKALDKAILYGTGNKMPVGIVTRLAQTSRPGDWGQYAPEWKDLHESNVIKTDATGIALFQKINTTAANLNDDYSTGPLTFVMSKQTHAKLVNESAAFNDAAAIVSELNNTMPLCGGDVVEVKGIPTGDIIMGYFDQYLLVERHGAQLASSTEVRFLEDQTAFKATARYDGKAVTGDAFAILNINNVEPTVKATFIPDKANPCLTALTIKLGSNDFIMPNIVKDQVFTLDGSKYKAGTDKCTLTVKAEEPYTIVCYQENEKVVKPETELDLVQGTNTFGVLVYTVGRSKYYSIKITGVQQAGDV